MGSDVRFVLGGLIVLLGLCVIPAFLGGGNGSSVAMSPSETKAFGKEAVEIAVAKNCDRYGNFIKKCKKQD